MYQNKNIDESIKIISNAEYTLKDNTKVKYTLKDNTKVKNVITFGTFDLFHEGYYNLLKRAKMYGDRLIVGVLSDELNFKKGKKSINDLNQKLEIVSNNFYVDEVFIEENLEDVPFNDVRYYISNAKLKNLGWDIKIDFLD